MTELGRNVVKREAGTHGRARAALRLSVIIPARNESRTLGQCLEAIRQSLDACEKVGACGEIILVDNGSTDDTVEIARAAGCRVLTCPDVPVGACRNRGAALAEGNVLAFVDADVIVPNRYFNELLAVLDGAQGRGVVGTLYTAPPDGGVVARAWQAQRNMTTRKSNLPAGSMMLRREVFDLLGGFDERLSSGEDTDLCRRARSHGLLVSAVPAASPLHLGDARTLGDVFRKQVWQGAGMWESSRLTQWSFTKAATLGFGLAHLAGLGVTLLGLGRSSGEFTAVGVAIWVLTPLLVTSCVVLAKIQNRHYFGPLLVVYYVYLTARALALLWRPGRCRG